MPDVFCPHCTNLIPGLPGKEAQTLVAHMILTHDRTIGMEEAMSLLRYKPPPPAAAPPPEMEEPGPEDYEDWEERTPEFITFDEAGQEISGILEGIDEMPFHDKTLARARVKTTDGVQAFLLTTQLEPLLAGILPGAHLRVRYEGEQLTSSKRKVKKFRVWTRKGG